MNFSSPLYVREGVQNTFFAVCCDMVLPHELTDTLRPQELISGFQKITFLSKNKKCVSPRTSGLTHFCYTICL